MIAHRFLSTQLGEGAWMFPSVPGTYDRPNQVRKYPDGKTMDMGGQRCYSRCVAAQP